MLHRSIPSSGQALPVVGLGTWQAFDVSTPVAYENLHQVISVMHEHAGRLIDSSPMYGRAEEVVGTLTKSSGIANDFFYATKVWTRGKEAGIRQMNESFNKLGRDTIDLMQIHNLVDWKIHLSTLK